MAKYKYQPAKAKRQSLAGKIVMWVLAVIMLAFVGYTLACLIGAAVSPDATFGEMFTTFFGVADASPAVPETTASLMF